MYQSNPVVWFEIYVNDMQRAVSFYESTFGCELKPMAAPGDDPLEMMCFPSDPDSKNMAAGALVKMDGYPGGGGGTIVYFNSEDCSLPAGRVEAAGGKVIQHKTSLGEHGYMALAQDTEGNVIGIHSMA